MRSTALLLCLALLALPGCGSLASWGGFGRGRFGLPGPGPFPAPFGGVRNDAEAIGWGLWFAGFDVPFSFVLDVVALPITAIGSFLERLERRPVTPVPPAHGERAAPTAPDAVDGRAPAELHAGCTVAFVIDVSCSMQWEFMSYDAGDGERRFGCKLERVQAEVARRIEALPDGVALEVVAFAEQVSTFAPEPEVATDDTKAAAIAWLNGLRPVPGSGSDTARGVQVALASARPHRVVILYTDGFPSRGGAPAEHLERIRAANVQGARIDVHGIGAVGALRAFCRDIARSADGAFVEMP